jgi:fermentation-respiration switch protein FrsA (DUF1100 family)
MKKALLRIAVIAPILVVLLVLVALGAGSRLTASHQQAIGPPPGNLPIETVAIARPNAAPIAGWFIPSKPGQAGVLLLHSLRSNRREMLGRARFLHQAGYAVLMIDLQAHGETPGPFISFGYHEAADAHRAMAYLRSRLPNHPIGVIGVSLGGAAALLGERPVAADALVLESVYSNIGQAVENRLAIRFGPLASLLAPLLIWQLEPRLHIPPQRLAPLTAIAQLDSPVLIINGSEDLHTRPAEAEALLSQAPRPAALWLVTGAKHQDLHRYSHSAYRQEILAFFGKYL